MSKLLETIQSIDPDVNMFNGNHRSIPTWGKQYLKHFSFAFLCFWNNFLDLESIFGKLTPYRVLTHSTDKQPGLVLELFRTVLQHDNKLYATHYTGHYITLNYTTLYSTLHSVLLHDTLSITHYCTLHAILH